MSLGKFAGLADGQIWQSFKIANAHLEKGDPLQARAILGTVALDAGLETRFRLQAWHSFREAGGQPPDSVANEVLGVVAEVGLDQGNDLLATYSDQTAYYYNYAGGAVMWMHPDGSLDGHIDRVLAAARKIVPLIGPWNESRRPPPAKSNARINILTPTGLHFGEAPLQVLDGDRSAGPLVKAATALMGQLIAKSRK